MIAPQELLLEDLDGSVVLCAQLLAEVDLAGVALAERLENLVFLVEDRVRLRRRLLLLVLSLHLIVSKFISDLICFHCEFLIITIIKDASL